MRRWLFRIVILVVVLVLLTVVAVQFVLWSDLPHRMVLSQLQRDTGLHIEARELRTGWGGSSNLHELVISIPGEDHPFALAHAARIEHASLLPLIWGGDLAIREIHIDGLSIKLTQDATGRWTFDRIAALMEPAPSTGTGEPGVDPYANLKVVRIDGAKFEVVDQQGRRALLEQIELHADALGSGTLRYEFTAAATKTSAQALHATGHIVMRGQWPHHLNLTMTGVRDIAGDWMQDIEGDVVGQVKWDGQLGDGLTGHAAIEKLQVSGYRIEGGVQLGSTAQGEFAVLKNLRITPPGEASEPVVLRSGQIRLSEGIVEFERLHVSAASIQARITGKYETATETGSIKGQWTEEVVDQVAGHAGTFEGTLGRSLTGLEASLTAQSTGQIAAVQWNGRIEIAANGPHWQHMDWTVAVSDGEVVIDVDGTPEPAAEVALEVAVDQESLEQVSAVQLHEIARLQRERAGRAPLLGHKYGELIRLSEPTLVYGAPRDDVDANAGLRPPLRPSALPTTTDDPTAAPAIAARPRHIPLTGVALAGRVRWPVLHLDRIRHKMAGAIGGDGRFNTQTLQWAANITGEGIEISPDLPVTNVDLAVAGTGDLISVERALFTGEQHEISLHGTYAVTERSTNAVSMKLKATWWDKETGPLAAQPPSVVLASSLDNVGAPTDPAPPTAAPPTPAPPLPPAPAGTAPLRTTAWAGRIRLEGDLTGQIDPLHLVVEGRLRADALYLNSQPVRALAMDVRGTIHEGRLLAKSGPFDLMEGDASMDLDYRVGGDNVDMKLNLNVVSLEALMRMVDPKLAMRGQSTARLAMTIPLDSPREVVVRGNWRVADFRYQEFAIEELSGRIRTKQPGVIEMNPIEVMQEAGRARGAMAVDLRSGVMGRLQLQLDKWPLDLEERQLNAEVDGDALVDIDFLAPTFAGTFNVTAQTQIAGEMLGFIKLVGEANPRQITLRIDGSKLLKGDVDGSMTLMTQEWWNSIGQVSWRNVPPAALVPWLAEVAQIEGGTKGSLTFGPAKATARGKPPEPLLMQLLIEPIDELSYRRIPLGKLKATVYGGPRRWLMDDMDAQVAGGRAVLWASLHQRGGDWHDHVALRFTDLDLDKLRRVFPDEVYNKPTPGKVTGNLTAYGQLNEWATHDGGGTIRLTESNLQNTDVIGKVLAAFGSRDNEPKGVGILDVRFERAALRIDRLMYRNRSTEILLSGSVVDLRKGMDSEIRGDALGSLRLIRSDDGGTLDSADRLLRAFQSNASAVTIRGTVSDPIVEQTIMRDFKTFIDRALGSP